MIRQPQAHSFPLFLGVGRAVGPMSPDSPWHLAGNISQLSANSFSSTISLLYVTENKQWTDASSGRLESVRDLLLEAREGLGGRTEIVTQADTLATQGRKGSHRRAQKPL
jgi:hypothetical protein